MSEDVQNRMNTIQLLAKQDTQYRSMLEQMKTLEKQYDLVLQALPYDQRDTVCDFVSLCEEMSWRMLEIACGYMRFPEQ